MSAPEPTLPRTEAQIFSLGWQDGERDQITPAIRRRLESMGLGTHIAGQQDNEPLDAA
jgi:hypothetical protein